MRVTRRVLLRLGGAAAGAGAFRMSRVFASLAEMPEAAEGLHWPAAQALPSFARPLHLDVGDVRGLTDAERTLLVTLQGVVNRRRPRLYWLQHGGTTDLRWLETSGVPYAMTPDPLSMVARYRSEVRGCVVFDPELNDSVNVATMLAGLTDGVVASPDLASRLAGAPFNLPVLDDLRGRFADKFAAYSWALDHLWPRLSHRLLAAISPTVSISAPGVVWTELSRETRQIRDASNRGVYTFDLSSHLGGEGVFVRFQDALPADGWGPSVRRVTVTADGTVIADFQPGTAAEEPFLYDANGSSLASAWRFADGGSFFVYRFAPPTGTTTLSLQVEMWNQYLVTATDKRPTLQVPFPRFRDYIVATRAFVFWLDPLVGAEREFFDRKVLAKVEPNTPYLGWFPGGHESEGVSLCSEHGVVVLAADFFNNGTVLGGIRAPIRASSPAVTTPPLENKVYVTLTMSEGDNIQYDQHRMRDLWDNPDRGRVPLNWSINPLLMDCGPGLLSYYQQTRTPNDLLVVGPSGAGYTYPNRWPAEALDELTRRTGLYMRRTGMDVIYAINRRDTVNEPLAEEVARSFVKHTRTLGILFNWVSRSQLSTPAGLPVITQVGIASVADGQRALADATADWAGQGPLFVALGVLAWTVTPTQVVALVNSLSEPYRIVRGDVFFRLLRQWLDER